LLTYPARTRLFGLRPDTHQPRTDPRTKYGRTLAAQAA
jgi:hypothetical protein